MVKGQLHKMSNLISLFVGNISHITWVVTARYRLSWIMVQVTVKVSRAGLMRLQVHVASSPTLDGSNYC